MLTPHEFKRTRAARPRPDLGGDDLADLGTTCWCVGRISTYKHLSIGKAHAVLPKNWFVLAASGRPVWAAVRGGVGVACRTGGRQYWPTPWPSAVVASVRVAGVLAGGPCRWCPSAVLAVGPWWCPSVAVVAVFVAAGGLSAVRWSTGPPWSFRGPWRPVFGPCQWCAVVASAGLVCLPCQVVVFRRRLRPSPLVCGAGACVPCCAVGGRGGRVAGRPCWCRWCRCHCAVPWPVVRVAGRQYGPPCGGVLVVSLRRALLGRVPFPSVRAGVRRGGRWPCPSVLAGVLVCGRWLAFVSCRIPWPWWPVWAVGRCWCPSLVLVARVGLVLGLADWLAVWALPVAGGGGWRCLRLRWCLPCQ